MFPINEATTSDDAPVTILFQGDVELEALKFFS